MIDYTNIDSLTGKIIWGDCLDIMRRMPNKCVDLILCDLPYGTTACSWDIVIPFEPLWEQYKRIVKDNTAIVLFGSQPFTTDFINSNRKRFKYEWIWNKTFGKDPFAKGKRPQKSHENICIFYKNQPTFNPIKIKGIPYIDKRINQKIKSSHYIKDRVGICNYGEREPVSIINIKHSNNNQNHETQKPVDLCKYLIKTYSNEGDLVLDNCSGSGTTAVACRELGRRWIMIEKELRYVGLSRRRLDAVISQQRLFV